MPPGPGSGATAFVDQRAAGRPPAATRRAKYAAAITAVILMKNWIMSMTSTPHSPECAANTTFSDADDQQRLPALQAEQDAGDLAGGQVDRRHDHAVEEEPEVDRAEAAHDDAAFPE